MKTDRALAAVAAALLATAMPAVGATDATVDAALAPLGFLAGHCWVTQLSADEINTHCYEWVHGGMQLRDRHVVRGKNPDYSGETVYAYNGERKRVEYRYWNSLGGQSDGYVETGAEGTLRFLDERYVGPDGSVLLFSSELSQPADGQYRMVSRIKEGETWKEMSSRLFVREASAATTTQFFNLREDRGIVEMASVEKVTLTFSCW